MLLELANLRGLVAMLVCKIRMYFIQRGQVHIEAFPMPGSAFNHDHLLARTHFYYFNFPMWPALLAGFTDSAHMVKAGWCDVV